MSKLAQSLVLGLCAGLATATDGQTATVVAAQYRCEGFLCPQWAIDISRYDPLRKLNQTFEYTLAEALPLAPTFQRQMGLTTAFDPNTRIFTVAAMSYPAAGLDSFWQVVISDDILSSVPVVTNVIVPHPDTGPDSPGALTMLRIVQGVDGGILGIFTDGTITTIDIPGQQHSVFASLNQDGTSAQKISTAHVVDGTLLRSFTADSLNGQYLVTVDLESAVVSAPLHIKPYYVNGEGVETSTDAALYTPFPGSPQQLLLTSAGNFDMFMMVDTTTGEQSPVIFNLFESAGIVLECHLATFDCDTQWNTVTVDKTNPDGDIIYFQAHTDPDVSDTVAMYKLQWYPNQVLGGYTPIIAEMAFPMNFGYSGYQSVAFL
jgi:hypothetical protein